MSIILLLPTSLQLPGSDMDTDPKAKSSFVELLEGLTWLLIFYGFTKSYSFSSLIWVKSPFSQIVLYAELHPYFWLPWNQPGFTLVQFVYMFGCLEFFPWSKQGLLIGFSVVLIWSSLLGQNRATLQRVIARSIWFQCRTYLTDENKKD